MISFFTTAKPFRGHDRIIQRNALASWKLLHPEAEVILFGDEEGAAEACAELGLRHEPEVERFEGKLPYFSFLFARAQEMARHDVLCYLNCDIILLPDFCRAVERMKKVHVSFMMIGRRWDTEVREPIEFASASWEEETRRRAKEANDQRNEWWIDYFAFTRGVFNGDLPRLVIGRPRWDNWTVWKALQNCPVVDASEEVMAVHQNHGYGYHPQGLTGIFKSKEADRNLELAGGWGHLRTIADASLALGPGGLRPNRMRHWMEFKRGAGAAGRFVRYRMWNPVWFLFLGITRPLRSALGLRAAARRSRP